MSGRIRTIKPEWLEDELLALASDAARVLSVALMLLADDFGNGRANPLQIAGQVFPGKVPETAANALDELRSIRFVVLYEVDGQRYFSIRNWSKHQRVDKVGKPRVPKPSDANARKCEPNASLAKVPEGLANVSASSENLPSSRASEVVVVVYDQGPDPGQAKPPVSAARRQLLALQKSAPDDVAVLEAWQARYKKTDVLFTADRTTDLADRRAEGVTQQDALDAVDGAAGDAWFLAQGTKFALLFNKRERFETYRDAGRALRGAAPADDRAQRSQAAQRKHEAWKLEQERKATENARASLLARGLDPDNLGMAEIRKAIATVG